jgi:hypothetical protein
MGLMKNLLSIFKHVNKYPHTDEYWQELYIQKLEKQGVKTW